MAYDSMDKRDYEFADMFINEYKASLYYDKLLADLQDKLSLLESTMGYHSPSLGSDGGGNRRSRDERLADYVVKVTKIRNQIGNVLRQKTKVESVCELIPSNILEHMHNIYTGRYNYEEAGYRYGCSGRTFFKIVRRAVIKALKEYEGI